MLAETPKLKIFDALNKKTARRRSMDSPFDLIRLLIRRGGATYCLADGGFASGIGAGSAMNEVPRSYDAAILCASSEDCSKVCDWHFSDVVGLTDDVGSWG